MPPVKSSVGSSNSKRRLRRERVEQLLIISEVLVGIEHKWSRLGLGSRADWRTEPCGHLAASFNQGGIGRSAAALRESTNSPLDAERCHDKTLLLFTLSNTLGGEMIHDKMEGCFGNSTLGFSPSKADSAISSGGLTGVRRLCSSCFRLSHGYNRDVAGAVALLACTHRATPKILLEAVVFSC